MQDYWTIECGMFRKTKKFFNLKPRLLVLGDEKHKELSIKYGLGIDAGGTYTDAAIYNFKSQTLISKNKALTTKWNFSIGIDQALSKLDDKTISNIELVSVSTTLATNAIVEGNGQKAGLILMPGPGNVSDSLITHTPRVQVKGQMSMSGQELQAVDPDEIIRAAKQMIETSNVTTFAVSGFAGAVNPDHELEVKQILQTTTGMAVSCGHELSDLLNFVVRAQTAVLNARIIPRMIKFFKELDIVLKKRGIKAPVMVVKGDGTLMSSTMAKQRPVETILSGPAASVAGAKLLTGLNNAMVVDIGGTTTDTADLTEGVVDVCEAGATVGGFTTHVKALNMRTIGLGGDSLIYWHKDKLIIGPKRVGPIAWADAQSPDGIGKALNFMEFQLKLKPRYVFSQVILVAIKGDCPFEPTQDETNLYNILLKRPYSMSELTALLGLFSVKTLPIERFKESGLIQECGFTPTDILHINKKFNKWNTNAAQRMANILATLSQTDPKILLDSLLKKFEKKLAAELFKKQLAKDVNINESEENELSRYFMECILSEKNDRYSIKAQLNNPIIGIGAPVSYFLPNAGKKLNTNVVIPENADVANALGAITSHVMIKRKISIRLNPLGCFIVEGLKGGKQFQNIDEAEAWAIEHLKTNILKMGRLAGTSKKTIEMEINDSIAETTDGTSLFLNRTIQAKLSGRPDLVIKSA